MQPGPIGIGWTSVAVMIDDGQSYTATPGHSAIRRASDEDEDVEIVQVVRPPLLPEVITLSDTEEGEEADEANSSSSCGKALKKRKGPLPVNQSPRKEQRIKSPSPVSSAHPTVHATVYYYPSIENAGITTLRPKTTILKSRCPRRRPFAIEIWIRKMSTVVYTARCRVASHLEAYGGGTTNEAELTIECNR